MNLPRFTAEKSLSPTIGYYQTNARAVARSGGGAGKILLALTGEVIEVHGCAPGSVLVESGNSWGCLPRSLVDWLLEPEGGTPTPPIPPGGGGGGGGGTPASVPADIVASCVKVCGRTGEKCCGGPVGPHPCKVCAQIVCQQKKCAATNRCDPDLLNEAKEEACDRSCDLPGCKDGLIVKESVVAGRVAVLL